MRDPYTVLGVKRDAAADEIKKAYRKLAKTLHPDHNAKDPKAQERFSELNAAYEILGDKKKRGAFDRGEIDAEGKPKAYAHPGFDPGAGGAGGFRFDFGTGGNPFGGGGPRVDPRTDPRDIFSDLFRKFEGGPQAGPQPGARRQNAPPAGEDVQITASATLEDVAQGGATRVGLPGGRVVEVKIPKGVADGTTMRLKGQGHPSPYGGAAGDALVTIHYARHPRFVVDGADLRTSVPVPLRDAVLGGNVRVPTLSGEVELTVPAWTSGGKTLRLRGRGLPLKDRTGDLFVTLDLDLGEQDAEIEAFFRRRKA